MSSAAERQLQKRLRVAIAEVTPGVQVQVFVSGKKKIDIAVGETYRYYDWASLTKVVNTVSLLMKAESAAELDSGDMLARFLPWAPLNVALRDLLTHSAGFPWWVPLFQSMPLEETFENKRLFLARTLRDLKRDGLDLGGLLKQKKSMYSDIDFWFLGLALESGGLSIDRQFGEFAEQMGMSETRFHRENRPVHPRKFYAPTEACEWRKKTIQGEVHDENAWSLGGVAPHAGLFGPIDDLSRWALEIRKALHGESRVWTEKVIRKYTQRAIPAAQGDWTLGFMMPTPGSSSSGKYFSATAFGHTGFTGTSVWFDMKKDWIVCVLSNRVNPTRKNEKFKLLRPQIHDWAIEALNL